MDDLTLNQLATFLEGISEQANRPLTFRDEAEYLKYLQKHGQ